MTRQFTDKDVHSWESDGKTFYKIICDREDLIYAPLEWQKRGLQQTASGYGRKLTNPYRISFNGKEYRLYTTIYSNTGSTWFQVRGKTIFVD